MTSLLPVLNVLGFVVMLFAFTMLVPLLFALGGHDAALLAFSESFLGTFVAGLVVWLLTRHFKRELQIRDGFLLVSSVWTVLPAVATLPLLLYFGDLGVPIGFVDAYFETVSGLTTTGATVLTGLDHLPQSLNVWRGLLVWIGGMGILVLAVAILPLLGVGGSQIYKAETPGPMKENKLTPRIAETAKGLYSVYAGLSLACFLCFWAAGMDKVDAFIHMCSTMGLGGFSSHDASFGYFDSVGIEAVAIVFMLLAGINFSMHFVAWRQKSFSPYVNCPETRWYLLAVLGGTALISLFLLEHQVYREYGASLRYALFNTVSIATTTGFANTDYNLWPAFAPVLMLFLSVFSSCAGSTGGGIKMIRAVLLLKQAHRELAHVLHPRAVNPVKLGGQRVDAAIMYGVLAFMLMYGSTVIGATLLLLFSGLDAVTAFSAIIACINNTGPGLHQVGPATTFAILNDFQTGVCTLVMLLGRLELFSLIVIFTPAFWRK